MAQESDDQKAAIRKEICDMFEVEDTPRGHRVLRRAIGVAEWLEAYEEEKRRRSVRGVFFIGRWLLRFAALGAVVAVLMWSGKMESPFK